MTERNCKLYSAVGGYAPTTGAVNVMPATTEGYDCGYYAGYAFNTGEATLLFAAFAHNQDTCCKACAATSGCTAATYTPEPSGNAGSGRRLLQPAMGEGFGLHLVNVVASVTTGGLDVATLEQHFTDRLGDMTKFDAFMDYSAQLFTANLPAYSAKFSADKVPFLAASWPTDGQGSTTWYSLFVRVPESQLIIELVGTESPADSLTPLETRMSSRQVAIYSKYVKDENNLLYAAAVNRATSNMTAVEDFYTNVIKATTVLTVDLPSYGISRRCFAWNTAQSDVCFTSRPTGSQGSFTVKDFEQMLWSVHSSVMTDPTKADKYQDNHYAVDTQVSGDYIAQYFTAHNPFPLSKDSPFAFACMQDYIIDPTGNSIQTDLFFTQQYPGCGWSTSSPALKHLRGAHH